MFGNVIQSIRIEFAGIPAGFCEALSTRECGKRSDANPISVPCSAFAKAQSLVEFREFVLQPSQFPDLTLVRHRSLAKYHERSPAMSNYHSANKPPFGPLAAIIHRREPNDIQYIEKMRTTLRWWDRCRWFGIALYGSLLAALIWLCHKFEPFICEMQAALAGVNPNANQVLLFAAVLGFTVGAAFQHAVCGILTALSGFRSERLLIRLYDEHSACGASDPSGSRVHGGR